MAQRRRQRLQVETRLVGEYLAERYPDARTFQRCRIGPLPPGLPTAGLSEAETRTLWVWRRWVDAIAVVDHRVILIEAGLLPDLGDISKLVGYMRMFRGSPDWQEYRDWPLEGELVWAVDDPVGRRLALDAGLRVVLFHPAWVDEYLATLAARHRRAPLPPLPD